MRDEGLGLRVQGLGFRVQGLGCGVEVLDLMVCGKARRVSGSGLRRKSETSSHTMH